MKKLLKNLLFYFKKKEKILKEIFFFPLAGFFFIKKKFKIFNNFYFNSKIKIKNKFFNFKNLFKFKIFTLKFKILFLEKWYNKKNFKKKFLNYVFYIILYLILYLVLLFLTLILLIKNINNNILIHIFIFSLLIFFRDFSFYFYFYVKYNKIMDLIYYKKIKKIKIPADFWSKKSINKSFQKKKGITDEEVYRLLGIEYFDLKLKFSDGTINNYILLNIIEKIFETLPESVKLTCPGRLKKDFKLNPTPLNELNLKYKYPSCKEVMPFYIEENETFFHSFFSCTLINQKRHIFCLVYDDITPNTDWGCWSYKGFEHKDFWLASRNSRRKDLNFQNFKLFKKVFNYLKKYFLKLKIFLNNLKNKSFIEIVINFYLLFDLKYLIYKLLLFLNFFK